MLVSVASQILSRSGRDEQAMLVTIAGIIATLMLLISQIRELFDMIVSAFGMQNDNFEIVYGGSFDFGELYRDKAMEI